MGGATALHEQLYTAYLLVQWISLSTVLILLNKHILSTAGFNFPVTLVLMHMSFCSLCALIWKLCGWITVPHLGGPTVYCVRFVPVGLFFAASLSLGNAAYLFISVAFVQMLKASMPVATLLVSFWVTRTFRDVYAAAVDTIFVCCVRSEDEDVAKPYRKASMAETVLHGSSKNLISA